MMRASRAVGSPGFPHDENEIAERAGRAFDRCYDPMGAARQAIATVASGDRTERLRGLKLPALVLHGLADRMCDVSGGRATGEAIPGAELVLIEGMGHDLAPGLRERLAEYICEFVLASGGVRARRIEGLAVDVCAGSFLLRRLPTRRTHEPIERDEMRDHQ